MEPTEAWHLLRERGGTMRPTIRGGLAHEWGTCSEAEKADIKEHVPEFRTWLWSRCPDAEQHECEWYDKIWVRWFRRRLNEMVERGYDRRAAARAGLKKCECLSERTRSVLEREFRGEVLL